MQLYISCDENGITALEWWVDLRKLTMYPNDDLLIKLWGTNLETEMEEISLANATAVRAAFEWLYGFPQNPFYGPPYQAQTISESKMEPMEEIIRNLYAGYTIGWMCPKCSRVNSPNSMSCPCVPMVVSCGRLGQTFTLD